MIGAVKKPSIAPKNVDEYLARVPEPGRSTLASVRAVIRAAVPREATEAISYGMPTFKYKGSLLSFGAFSKHCSLFPMSMAVIGEYEKELKRFHTSRGTLSFPLDKPMPASLLKKIVKARVAEKDRKN
jgi:uncharacterized protein YdhG (YjbR/CyaY superfamily)